MISQSNELEHAGSAEKTAPDIVQGAEKTENGDLERLQTTKEGEMLTQDANTKKREWIKAAPESPRNWPLWRKWWIIGGLLFYTTIVFICNTGFVTVEAEDQFGVNTESAVMGQSIVRVSHRIPTAPKVQLAPDYCSL